MDRDNHVSCHAPTSAPRGSGEHDDPSIGPDELDRSDTAILGGTGPILVVLGMALLTLLALQLGEVP